MTGDEVFLEPTSNFLQNVGFFLDFSSNEEESTGGPSNVNQEAGAEGGWVGKPPSMVWKPPSMDSSILRNEKLCIVYGPSSYVVC